MKTLGAGLGLLMTVAGNGAFAAEGATPSGIPHLKHVYVILMENHGFSQIFNNPNAPYVNGLAKSASYAANYFAVAHPSLTNYLEVVGGSNFGVHSDNYPDWHNASCTTNLTSAVPSTDNPASPLICPISGVGTDAATPAIDTTNETQGPPGDINIDGVASLAAVSNTSGKTIADQLVAHGLTWKSYQEDVAADRRRRRQHQRRRLHRKHWISPRSRRRLRLRYRRAMSSRFTPSSIIRSPISRMLQDGLNPKSSLQNIVGFTGAGGLYDDLADGKSPTYSFVAPNQCNDQPRPWQRRDVL